MEGAPHRYHEDHIAEQGMNSSSHYNLVHKFILMLQAMKNIRCKGSSGNNGTTRENPCMAADESQKQK